MRRYVELMADSARWDGFELRDGDIIIATPVKSGTTWMQMCVALVIFQTPDLPKPMAELSPWLDMLTATREDVVALLDAQQHRRFIKTHTPLDGLPDDARVTYICVGRDPRDVARSLENHLKNWSVDALLAARERTVGLGGMRHEDVPVDLTDDPVAWFWAWVGGEGLARIFEHLQTFWDRRDEPNVHLFHYADLETDLAGQLRRLADVLHVEVPEERWDLLLEAATFSAMKARADVLAPNTDFGLWKRNSQFFDQGRSGRWRDWITDETLPRYEARVAELVAPDLAHWAHHGWLGA